RIRIAAKRGDSSRVMESVAALAQYADKWPAVAVEQYRALQSAVDGGNATDAGRAVQFLRNALVRLPAFRESLAEIKPATELIADPFRRFLRLPSPSAIPSPS